MDSAKIYQILMNLCTNAYQAMPEGKGNIDIAVEKCSQKEPLCCYNVELPPGDYLQISIKDNGLGIEGKNLEKIFDPYFTTKEMEKGTGLGLATVYGIARNLEGGIRVESEVGTGTIFEVFLPSTPPEPEPKVETYDKKLKGDERILFIDDEFSIVRLQKRSLEKFGYIVIGETDALHAMELFKSDPEHFDIIITDMTMPKICGDELARKIKKIKPDIPIVLCTGFSEKIDVQKTADMGLAGFLMKPVDSKRLAIEIRKVLDEA